MEIIPLELARDDLPSIFDRVCKGERVSIAHDGKVIALQMAGKPTSGSELAQRWRNLAGSWDSDETFEEEVASIRASRVNTGPIDL